MEIQEQSSSSAATAELLPFSLSGKEQREVFREHHPEIQNMLDVDQVLPYLNQHKLLTIAEQEELQNFFHKRSQVISRLVIWIPRKGSDALWKFMVCLKSSSDGTAHDELVTVLQCSVDEMIKRRGQKNMATGSPSLFQKRWVRISIVAIILLAIILGSPYVRPCFHTLAYHLNLYHSKSLPYYDTQHFTGREKEMGDILEMVDFANPDVRIVSIVGPPGFGKSTLAIHVGHDMVAQGVVLYYVQMSEVTSLQSLAEKVLEGDETIVLIRNVTVDRLFEWARGLHHETLLILDNCDDMLHKGEDLLHKNVKKLVESSQKLKILMTSRQKGMQLNKFRLYTLEELSLEASCSLLWSITDSLDNETCKVIATLTGNAPLALQVVGALLTQPDPPDPKTVIEGLEKQLMLTLSPRQLPIDRVNASIALSYQYLDVRVQKSGRYLANLPGSFDKTAACQILRSFVVDCDYVVDDEIVFRSLLQHNRRTNRYQFHQLIREFFLDIQKSMGSVGLDESEQFSSEFRTHYAQILHTLSAAFSTKTWHKRALALLDTERHNIHHLLYHEVDFQVIRSFEVAMSQNFLQCRFTRDELDRPLQSSVRYIADNWKAISTDAEFFGIYTRLLIILVSQLQDTTLAIHELTLHGDVIENIRVRIPGKEGAIPYLTFYGQLSQYYKVKQHHDSVKMCHERILQAKDQLKECEPGTCDYFSIGNIHYYLEDYENSAYFYELALKLQEMDGITKVETMISLHNSYKNIHQEQKAASIMEEAVALFPSLMNVSSGECFRHYDKLEKIAKFYREKGQVREAYGIEEMQLDVLLELGPQPDGEIAHRGIRCALLLIERGDYDKAITMVEFGTKSYITLVLKNRLSAIHYLTVTFAFEESFANIAHSMNLLHVHVQDQETLMEQVTLNKWYLIAIAKHLGGNYSESLEYYESAVNFIFEQNKATIYASQLSHACSWLVYRGHRKCLNYVITEKVFSAGKWIVYGVFGTLFNIDIDALIPEPPEIVDEQLSRLSSSQELDPPKLHEPSIRHWKGLPLSRSWLQHIIIVTSYIKQALVDINLLRFMVKCVLKCLLFSVEVIGVVARLYLVYSIQLVVHWTRVCARRIASELVCCVYIVLLYIMVLQV